MEWVSAQTELNPLQLIVIGGALFAMNAIALSAFAFFVYHAIRKRPSDSWLFQILKREFAALVLIPILAGTALCIVLMFEVTTGTVEFSFIGFRFKGASGHVVLWVLCFLALVAALKLLWQGEPNKAQGKHQSGSKTS